MSWRVLQAARRGHRVIRLVTHLAAGIEGRTHLDAGGWEFDCEDCDAYFTGLTEAEARELLEDEDAHTHVQRPPGLW